MIVISYDPPNKDPKVWEFEETSWTYGETVTLERKFGANRDDFFDAVANGSDTARRLLLWIIRKRDEPELQLEDLDDLLVSYLTFLKVTPKEEADPKALEEGPEPEASEPKSNLISSDSEPTSDSTPATSTP